jgi:hypothetical protein
MTVDTHIQGHPDLILQKKTWDAPKLTHFRAGSAEFEGAGQSDNVDLS